MRTIPPNIVVMDRGNDTTCTIHLHGATIASWTINGEEQLFLSKLAIFNGRAPIRGGITLQFPHHGKWAFGPRHGFSRILSWKIDKSPHKLKSGDIEAVLSLSENEFTKSMWNYPFRLVYTLELHETELHFNVCVHNTGQHLSFRSMIAFHIYLRVPDVTECELQGFEGCSYIDKLENEGRSTEGEESIKISNRVDRIYTDTPNDFVVTKVMSGHKVHVKKSNLPDTVVWSPWVELSEEIKDLSNDEYSRFFYFAPGMMCKLITLPPGGSFEGKTILSNSRKLTIATF